MSSLDTAGPIGRCIYCGDPNPPLSDEHIVPYGFGGTWVLRSASCAVCARITSRVELAVLRRDFGALRAVGRFPTRRPKQRQREVPLTLHLAEGSRRVDLPVGKASAFCTLPIFAPAPARSGRPHQQGITIIGAELIGLGATPNELASQYGATGLTEVHKPHIEEFARMVGKIGYCVAVAHFGLDAIARCPPILDAILGRTDDIGRWVGSTEWRSETEKQGATLVVGSFVEQIGHSRVVVALVKLFAPHSTAYEVVVGPLV
jgi:hypothetical protein